MSWNRFSATEMADFLNLIFAKPKVHVVFYAYTRVCTMHLCTVSTYYTHTQPNHSNFVYSVCSGLKGKTETH